MGDTRTDYAGTAAQAFPFSARERQHLIEPIMAFYESVNELRDDQKLHLVTLYEYHQTLDALAAAEQRATASEARAERLAKYLSGFDVTEDGEVRDEDGEPFEDTFIVNIGMQAAGIKEIHAALTAPATQPDERAAAERALLDRLAKRILAEIVYCAPENRALAEEVAQVAKIETDLIVGRHGDTDGAAKEGV